MSPVACKDKEKRGEPSTQKLQKASEESKKGVFGKNKELQPVPLGGQRIPDGMEDHANWQDLPIVMPTGEGGKNASNASSCALDEVCKKSDSFVCLMDLRNSLELVKKYLAAISRNAAILSRAKGLQTDKTTGNTISNSKPANIRPQSMSTQNATKDMQETIQCLKDLKQYTVKSIDNDSEIDADLQKKCREFVESSKKTLSDSIDVGLNFAAQDPTSAHITEFTSNVTNATRDLFQSKNNLLNLIKEIKQQISTKYNIPMNVPATFQATPAA